LRQNFQIAIGTLADRQIKFKKSRDYVDIFTLFIMFAAFTFLEIMCFLLTLAEHEYMSIVITALVILWIITSYLLWMLIWNIRGYELLEVDETKTSLTYGGSIASRGGTWKNKDIAFIGVDQEFHDHRFIRPFLILKKGHGYLEMTNGSRVYFGQDTLPEEIKELLGMQREN